MKAIDLLTKEKLIFSEDAVEGKKTKQGVELVNKLFIEMKQEIENFEKFSSSQLKGEYHDKIAKSKGIVESFANWKQFNTAFSKLENEEANEISLYNTKKTNLINALNNLLVESEKECVVSLYDLIDGELSLCEKGHEVVIIGEHGREIILNVIDNLTSELKVEGNYSKIEANQIKIDYTTVEKNVEVCGQKTQEIFAGKEMKIAKINISIGTMQEIAKKIVYFETCKPIFVSLGIAEKDIENYEKNFTKQYIGLKKSLQKVLKMEFLDICDIKVNENDFVETDLENPQPYVDYKGEDDDVDDGNDAVEQADSIVEDSLQQNNETEDLQQSEETSQIIDENKGVVNSINNNINEQKTLSGNEEIENVNKIENNSFSNDFDKQSNNVGFSKKEVYISNNQNINGSDELFNPINNNNQKDENVEKDIIEEDDGLLNDVNGNTNKEV